MMRLWPDSLASRTLAILLGITLLLIAGSAILLQEERNTRFEEQNRFRLLNNISTLVRLVEGANFGNVSVLSIASARKISTPASPRPLW